VEEIIPGGDDGKPVRRGRFPGRLVLFRDSLGTAGNQEKTKKAQSMEAQDSPGGAPDSVL
jgi:hypothetical protein